MTPSNEKTKTPVKPATAVKPKAVAKAVSLEPKSTANYMKAVSLGKQLSEKPETSKMDVATKMYDLIKDEPRQVIAQAFIAGANLTEKGAMTYVYNIRRKLKKSS